MTQWLLLAVILLLFRAVQHLRVIAKNQVEHAKQFGLIIQGTQEG